jgi:hypothetical protein
VDDWIKSSVTHQLFVLIEPLYFTNLSDNHSGCVLPNARNRQQP